jgi:hypothetical protein
VSAAPEFHAKLAVELSGLFERTSRRGPRNEVYAVAGASGPIANARQGFGLQFPGPVEVISASQQAALVQLLRSFLLGIHLQIELPAVAGLLLISQPQYVQVKARNPRHQGPSNCCRKLSCRNLGDTLRCKKSPIARPQIPPTVTNAN